MGGIVNSIGGLLGFGSGPSAPSMGAEGATELSQMAQLPRNYAMQGLINQYAQGGTPLSGVENAALNTQPYFAPAVANQLAESPLTSARLANDALSQTPIYSQLYGGGQGQTGLLGQEINKEQQLQNQGYNLQPEDQTMYGQVAGNIARQFGQQGNQTAQDLAARGLSNSGAAGAAFSGLQGNQNEMLAQAQEQIAQQRFQNTLQQIQQQQQFINQLGAQGQNALQGQQAQNREGAQAMTGGLAQAAQTQMAVNQGNLAGLEYQAQNQPKNLVDIAAPAAAGFGMGSLFGAFPGSGSVPGAAGGAEAASAGASLGQAAQPFNYVPSSRGLMS